MVTVKRYIGHFRRPFASSRWRKFVLALLLACGLLVLVRAFLLTQVEVSVDRPDLGLLAGDRLLVNRVSYGLRLPFARPAGSLRWGKSLPARGEMVVFDYPAGSGHWQVERTSALAGDTLWQGAGRRSYSVVPEGHFVAGHYVIPEYCLVGRPLCTTYSLTPPKPFFRKVRTWRFFLLIP